MSAPKKAAPKAVEDFPGLTAKACATACGIEGCALGTSYCSHPNKGGLQADDMGKLDSIEQQQKARKQLAVASAEKLVR